MWKSPITKTNLIGSLIGPGSLVGGEASFCSFFPRSWAACSVANALFWYQVTTTNDDTIVDATARRTQLTAVLRRQMVEARGDPSTTAGVFMSVVWRRYRPGSGWRRGGMVVVVQSRRLLIYER